MRVDGLATSDRDVAGEAWTEGAKLARPESYPGFVAFEVEQALHFHIGKCVSFLARTACTAHLHLLPSARSVGEGSIL